MIKGILFIVGFILLICGMLQGQEYSISILNRSGGYQFTGDYSGIVYAKNFTIGPYDTPFSVTLEPIGQVTDTVCGGISYTKGVAFQMKELAYWQVDGSATETATITLSTSEASSQIAASAIWQYTLFGDGYFDMQDPGIISWFCPPRDTALVGEAFSMTHYLNLPGIFSFELVIHYDPAILQVVDVILHNYDVNVTADYSNPGSIIINGTVDGHVSTCYVRWRAVNDGNSSLAFDFLRFTDQYGNPALVNNTDPKGYTCGVTVHKSLYLFGDINGDDQVDIIDALLIAQYYVGICGCTVDHRMSDMDRDGAITIVDALLIARYYVGLEPVIPLP